MATMNIEEKKKKLEIEINELLSRVKKGTLGYGVEFDTLCDDDLTRLEHWREEVEELIEVYGLECHKKQFQEVAWIINQNRVDLSKIGTIIKIIKRLKANYKENEND